MKTTVLTIISLAFLILLYSCGNKPKASDDTLIINENSDFKDTTLILENLVDDIRLIRLETNENCLISYFRGHVGDKYIIAFEQEKLLLFSGEGKFINVISKEGKGPNEFRYIDAWDVDEDEQFLYFHDTGKDYISRYNLDDTQFEDNIPLEDKGGLSGIVAVNDTLLAVSGASSSRYEHLYFYVSTSGRIIEEGEKKPSENLGRWGGSNFIFERSTDNSIFYQLFEADTIFKIKGTDKQPALVMQLEEPLKNGNKSEGYHVGFLGQIGNQIYLKKSMYESEVAPNRATLSTYDVKRLLYDLNEKEIYQIDSFVYDALGSDFSYSFNIQNSNRLLVANQATTFKNMLESKMEDDDIDENQRKKLEQLNREISENDNPILITGKCR